MLVAQMRIFTFFIYKWNKCAFLVLITFQKISYSVYLFAHIMKYGNINSKLMICKDMYQKP